MGREIRRVPPNWAHPQVENWDVLKQKTVTSYQPMYDNPFAETMREWIARWDKWEAGERPDYCDEEGKKLPFWEWDGAPPRPEYYRPDWPEGTATWYQVYETVSEGTPVTPPFETQQELVDYLVANGDFWDQKRREDPRSVFSMPCDPWPRKAAERFVFGTGWAPSLVVDNGKVMSGVEFVTQDADLPRTEE